MSRTSHLPRRPPLLSIVAVVVMCAFTSTVAHAAPADKNPPQTSVQDIERPLPSPMPLVGASTAGWLLVGGVPTLFSIAGGGLVGWFAVQFATTPRNDNPNSHDGMGLGLSMSITGGAVALMVPLSIIGATAGAAVWGALTSEKNLGVRWAPTLGAVTGGVGCVLVAGGLGALGVGLLSIPTTATAAVGITAVVGAFATLVAVGPASVGGAVLFHRLAASNVEPVRPRPTRFNIVPERDIE